MLARYTRDQEAARLEARRLTRLGDNPPENVAACSGEQMRILRMSNADFQRFRAPQVGAQAAVAEPQAGLANPQVQQDQEE